MASLCNKIHRIQTRHLLKLVKSISTPANYQKK